MNFENHIKELHGDDNLGYWFWWTIEDISFNRIQQEDKDILLAKVQRKYCTWHLKT